MNLLKPRAFGAQTWTAAGSLGDPGKGSQEGRVWVGGGGRPNRWPAQSKDRACLGLQSGAERCFRPRRSDQSAILARIHMPSPSSHLACLLSRLGCPSLPCLALPCATHSHTLPPSPSPRHPSITHHPTPSHGLDARPVQVMAASSRPPSKT